MAFCANCGHEVKDGDKFCLSCGYKLVDEMQSKEPAEEGGSKDETIESPVINNQSSETISNTFPEKPNKDQKIIFCFQMWFIIVVFCLTYFVLGIPAIVLFIIRIVKYPEKRKSAWMGLAGTVAVAALVTAIAVYFSTKDSRAVDKLVNAGKYDEAFTYIESHYDQGSYSYYQEKAGIYEKQGDYDNAAVTFMEYIDNKNDLAHVSDGDVSTLNSYIGKVSKDVEDKINTKSNEISVAKKEEERKAAEEKAAKEAAEKKAAEEKEAKETAEKEAKEKKAAEEKAAKEAEKQAAADKKAAEKAAKEAEKQVNEAPKNNNTADTTATQQQTTAETAKVLSEKDKETILQWLTDHSYSPDKIKDKHVKKLKKITDEEGFYPIWISYVHDKTDYYKDDFYQTEVIVKCVALYKRTWPDTKHLNTIDAINSFGVNMDSAYKSISDIRKKYPYGDKDSLKSGVFTVTQRLSTIYTDNIVGKIQKEIDSYAPVNSSDWVAYDIADNCCVIHADYLNPFSEAGNYSVCYAKTNETSDLTDEQGFTKTVPVYYLISDEKQAYKDFNTLQTQLSTYKSNLEGFRKALDPTSSTSSSNNTTNANKSQSAYKGFTGNKNTQTSGNNTNTKNIEDEYIVPGSDTGSFDVSYFEQFSLDELRLARNEIFARHGRKFSDQTLQNYFNSKSWYTPLYEPEEFDARMESILNDWEMANVNAIKQVEANKKNNVMFTVTVSASDGYVNMRSGPGTEYDIITTIDTGVVLDVIDGITREDNGKVWYKVNFPRGTTSEGWISETQVKKN